MVAVKYKRLELPMFASFDTVAKQFLSTIDSMSHVSTGDMGDVHVKNSRLAIHPENWRAPLIRSMKEQALASIKAWSCIPGLFSIIS